MNKRLLIMASFSIVFSLTAKIKMYVQCTETHREMKDKYLLPSIKDDFEIIIENHEQRSSNGSYQSIGYHETMIDKTDLVIRAIKDNWEDIFIFSDVDIVFYKPCIPTITKLMEDKDVLFQRAYIKNRICTGFFVVRANEKTLDLWSKTLTTLKKYPGNTDPKKFDQEIIQNLLPKIENLRYGTLPDEFWSSGINSPKQWNPGDQLEVPDNIIMHHAAYVNGLKNKYIQLDLVRKIIEKTN